MDNKRKQVLAELTRIEAQLRAKFGDTYSQVMKIAQVRQAIENGAEFSWKNNPSANKMVDEKLNALNKATEKVISDGVKTGYSYGTNDGIGVGKGVGLGVSQKTIDNIANKSIEDMRKNGATAHDFYTKPQGGLTISDRIWNGNEQTKKELQAAINTCIQSGMSAKEATMKVRKWMLATEGLPKQVYNQKTGEYETNRYFPETTNAGRGVYRSSYANALRLARTEINMAYHSAEIEALRRNPLVVGYEIKTSGNHPKKAGKTEMCERLAGRYPKTFTWTGWHPQCRCHISPILCTEEEFKQRQIDIDNGKADDWKPSSTVTDLPKNFTDWLKANQDKLINGNSKPFFVRDNYRVRNGKLVLNKEIDDLAEAVKQQEADAKKEAEKPVTKKSPILVHDSDAYFEGTNGKWAEAVGLKADYDKLDLMRRTKGVTAEALEKAIDDINKKVMKKMDAWNVAYGVVRTQFGYSLVSKQGRLDRLVDNSEYKALNAEIEACSSSSSRNMDACLKKLDELKEKIKEFKEKVKKADANADYSKTITYELPKKEEYTTADVEQVFNEIHQKQVDAFLPAWTNNGFNIKDETRKNTQASMSNDGKTMSWNDKTRDATLSVLKKIANGDVDKITEEEYFLFENVWHELNHARRTGSKGTWDSYSDERCRTMEMVNEYVSRNTMNEFFATFGVKNPYIGYQNVSNNCGYDNMCSGLKKLVTTFNIDNDEFVKRAKISLYENGYDLVQKNIARILKDMVNQEDIDSYVKKRNFYGKKINQVTMSEDRWKEVIHEVVNEHWFGVTTLFEEWAGID